MTRKIVPDKDVEVIVKRYGKVLGAKMEKIIGSCDVRLDSRFSQIRIRETNLGNFIADTIRHSVNCDVVRVYGSSVYRLSHVLTSPHSTGSSELRYAESR